MSTIAGPDFVALQVRDLERAAAFYEQQLGLQRAASSPPHAVVFNTEPIALAVREPLPGTDLDRGQPGLGVGLWLRAQDAQATHDQLAAADVPIVAEPLDGPFGRTFSFRDPTSSPSTTPADGPHDPAAEAPSTFSPPPQCPGISRHQRRAPPRSRGSARRTFRAFRDSQRQLQDARATTDAGLADQLADWSPALLLHA